MSVHVASVLKVGKAGPAGPHVFRTEEDFDPPAFYWCCDLDGACGTHKLSIEAAIEEAALHLTTYHREEQHHDGR